MRLKISEWITLALVSDSTDFEHTIKKILLFAYLAGFAIVIFFVARALKRQYAHSNPKKKPVNISQNTSAAQARIKKIALTSVNPERVEEEIVEIVEEEVSQARAELKKEYLVKYQYIFDEKVKQVEHLKKENEESREKYATVQKMYKKVEAEKRQTEAVVRSVAEGLVVINNKGEVLMMNPSAERLLGAKSEKKIGQSLMEGLGDHAMISLSREAPDNDEKIIEFKNKNENVTKVIRSSSAVIQNENNETVGMVSVLTDVTKQKELDETKNRFVSNVTHELRTPIVAMQKAIEILFNPNAGTLNEAQTNFLHIVSRNLAHLSRLVEDVLDIARIDSGKMEIRSVATHVDETINDVCNSLGAWAREKKIELAKETAPGLPAVMADPPKITQVLNNLIGNAIKFTPSGGKITVQCRKAPEGNYLEVGVVDTGVGISPENLPKLFRRFEQLGARQSVGGTGLGLSISKEIVEKHGGRIFAESEGKNGSRFVFWLPI